MIKLCIRSNYIKSKYIIEFRIKAALLQLFLTTCRHKALPFKFQLTNLFSVNFFSPFLISKQSTVNSPQYSRKQVG